MQFRDMSDVVLDNHSTNTDKTKHHIIFSPKIFHDMFQ